MSVMTGELDGRVVLGRFHIVRLLARGGMGEIYLARSEGAAGFAMPVVVKRVLSAFADNESIVGMFKREARIMSNLRHPGIVSVLDFGRDGADYLLVLEYVHGFHVGRWARWLRGRGERFPVGRAVQVVLQTLDALEYAHAVRDADDRPLEVVHRDVSPSNVLIDVDGHVKLADFGVARMYGEQTEWQSGQGRTTTVKGKFPYLAPELFAGATPRAASDVYAAAVVLDELLRGRNVFNAENPQLTIARVIQHAPERLDVFRDDVPSALAAVLSRALSKAPTERLASAGDLAAALREVCPMGQDQALRELGDAARRDFHDLTFAPSLDVDDLHSLDRAWREGTPLHDDAPSEPSRSVARDSVAQTGPHEPTLSYPPTLAVRPPLWHGRSLAEPPLLPGATPPRPRPRAFVRLVALGGALIVAASLVSVVLALRGAPSAGGDRPVYVVVDRSVGGADAGSASRLVVDARVVAAPPVVPQVQGMSAEADVRPVPRQARPRAARASETVALTAPFRRRTSEIARCFSAHAGSLAGASSLVVRFEVGTDGTVTSATLTPTEVARQPLGACIVAVARSTAFGARSESVAFRIPLGARQSSQ